jgi:hypothetical protein
MHFVAILADELALAIIDPINTSSIPVVTNLVLAVNDLL